MDLTFDRRQVNRGLSLLMLCSLLGLGYVFLKASARETIDALRHVRPAYLLLLGALTFIDLWLGGIRNHIFLRHMKPGISSWLSFRANLANIFVGSITPSQSGGGPGQLYVLWRGGVPISGAIATSVLNFLATLTFFIVTVPAVLYFGLKSEQFSTGIWLFIGYAFIIFGFLLLLFFVSLAKPQWLESLVRALHARSVGSSSKRGKLILSGAERLLSGFQNYRKHTSFFLAQDRKTLWLTIFLTLILYWNKYNIAYVVIAGLGHTRGYFDVILLQNLQLFLIYFAPTPGASGLAEISAASLMRSQVPVHVMPLFAMLWRTFTVYLGVVLGGVGLWKELRGKRAVKSEQEVVAAAVNSGQEAVGGIGWRSSESG